jgi:uncharacterized protein
LSSVSTADKNGVPNVVPINFMKILDDETILASAVFMTKTFNNLKENPVCALSVWEGFAGYQFKGSVAILTDGSVFRETKSWTEEEGKKLGLPLQSKGAIVIRINEIFSVSPGAEAGKKSPDQSPYFINACCFGPASSGVPRNHCILQHLGFNQCKMSPKVLVSIFQIADSRLVSISCGLESAICNRLHCLMSSYERHPNDRPDAKQKKAI